MPIVPMQPWHLMSVMLNLRAGDKADFEAAGIDVQRFACQRALDNAVAIACVDKAGVPVACIGIQDQLGVGHVWLVSTDGMHAYRKSLIQAYRALLKAVSSEFRVIEACCRVKREGAARLLQYLGFEYRGERPRYFVNGESAMFFSKELNP